MRALATFRIGEESTQTAVSPGEFIGRSDLAALCLDDPRVSEAHALISLRGGCLKLLALRGRFSVRGEVVAEAMLEPGLVIGFAPDLLVTCETISLPAQLVGVKVGGLPAMTLMGTTSFRLRESPKVLQGFDPGAELVFWPMGEQWRARVEGEDARTVVFGDTFEAGGRPVEIITVDLKHAAQTSTKLGLRPPMRLHCADRRVRVEREGEQPVFIAGVPGRIFHSLLSRDLSATWRDVVSDVWPGDASTETALRRRFDAGLARLRGRIEELTGRDDFFQLDGTGLVIVALNESDSVELEG